MKEWRKPEFPEKIPGDELQKMPHTRAQRFKPQARLKPEIAPSHRKAYLGGDPISNILFPTDHRKQITGSRSQEADHRKTADSSSAPLSSPVSPPFGHISFLDSSELTAY